VQLNLALKEINCKVVYFGCGLGGKTTNLEIIHEKAAPDSRGELTSIATESDRTLFFDLMPLDLGEVSGMRVKFQLYTVPGQVYYNSTRKLVLRGADGVIFISDSQAAKMDENIESLDNLEECLQEQGRSLDEMPHVIQFNKRDMESIVSVEAMAAKLNRYGAPTFEAIASEGDGVLETFKALAGLMLERVKTMSMESASKPLQSARTAAHATQRQTTDRERLQGGLAGNTPKKPIPGPRVKEERLDRPAAARAPGPDPHSPTRPAAPAATAAAAKDASVAVASAERVKPSRRNVAPPTPVRVGPRAMRAITTAGGEVLDSSPMMVSTSRRRRKGGGGMVWVIVGVVAAIGAAAAAWFVFLGR